MKKLVVLVLTAIVLSIGVSACIPSGSMNSACDVTQCCGYTGVWTTEPTGCWYGIDLWTGWCMEEGGQNCPSQQCWISAVDADGDGYDDSIDCDDTDASINPSASEIVGNIVDENCDGISELSPEGEWNSQGQFVSSLVHALNDLVKEGKISKDQRLDILHNAIGLQK